MGKWVNGRSPSKLALRSKINRRIFFQSLLVGGICGLVCFGQLTLRESLAGDFTVSWLAARALVSGADPYQTIRPVGVYPFNAPFFYPLTAALAALPFAWLPPGLAGALFFGAGSGVLAYLLISLGEAYRLPLLISSSFFVSAAVAQWAPWILAGALTPWLAWFLACKPNAGLPLFLCRPSWRSSAVLGVFLLVSLAARPTWPLSWYRVVSAPSFHVPPFMILPLGWLLLFSVLRISTPAGRLLLAMALMPQSMWFHDQLALWLVPRNRDETWLLTFFSWLAYGLYRLQAGWGPPSSGSEHPGIYVVGLMYLPALALVLLRDPIHFRSLAGVAGEK
jgi:hypothetical protein